MENLKLPDASELKASLSKYSPFVREVKKRFIITFLIFILATLVGFIFYEKIIKSLIELLSLKGVNIVFTSPFQFINLAINCGIASGLIVVFPLIIFQILSFLKPALKKKEYKTVLRLIPLCVLLFLTGFIFGGLIMKWQIQIFLYRSVSLGIGNILDISHLLSVVLLTSTLMGAAFQFPIVLLLLMRLNILKPGQLAKQRFWVYIGSFIFAVLLPPDSILADIVLSLPLIVLFELTLILNRLSTTKEH